MDVSTGSVPPNHHTLRAVGGLDVLMRCIVGGANPFESMAPHAIVVKHNRTDFIVVLCRRLCDCEGAIVVIIDSS
jgi:hypothetical protein